MEVEMSKNNKPIEIVEWTERYEVSSKGREPKSDDELRAGPLQFIRLKVYGHAQGTGFRRLKSVAGDRTMEVFGLFCKFLEIAGNQKRGQRGVLLNEKNQPATADDLAFILDAPVEQVKNAIRVLCDKKVGWLKNGNSTQLNSTQLNSTNQPSVRKIPEISGNAKAQRDKSFSEDNKQFNQFWLAYPKKVSKVDAKKAFKRIKPSDALLNKMITALEQQSKTEQWLKERKRYVPNPATWLNQERWEDEIETTETTAEQVARMEREGKL